MENTYSGYCYQAESGAWAWVVIENETEAVVRGAGYDTEAEANEAMEEELLIWSEPPQTPPGAVSSS